ncbi:hypothetical protein [Streptomyces sp. NBC_00658]|uniref:hypothetical protein n=1 Tax=Streptomyces sp. NBC_00658 TaxID=2975800 RepID=UPI0032507EA1
MRGIKLRADQLATANGVTEQLSLGGSREKLLRLERVIGRANARFGTGAVVPATLANRRAG